jgi:N-acetylglucosamine-6-phosphate deacetylase
MALIGAGTIVLADGVLDGRICRPGWLEARGGRIVACGCGPPPRPADNDFPDATVVPGFVDMHVHGGGGASYIDGTRAEVSRAATFHLRHGTTTTLASLVTLPRNTLLDTVIALTDLTEQGTVAGIHLEGPWLSAARCGAHDPTQMRDPGPGEIDALLDAADGAIRMVTLAPELAGSHDAIERFVGAGIVVALGHTDATYEQARAALTLGATVGTHLFNAMRPLHHRDPGAALALLEDPAVSVEIIADGVHVHPAVVRRVIETAGPGRIALITDAIAAAGSADGSFPFGALEVDVVSGVARLRGTSTIAGGTATMDQLLRNVLKWLGPASDDALVAAVRMTSATPAAALGLNDVGALRAGLRADLVVLDRDWRVSAVMAGGVWQPLSDPGRQAP